MKTLKFKTNINCGGCIAGVTPTLNGLEGIEKWNVDTNDSNKILTIETNELNPVTIKDAIEKAGFKAEEIK